MRRQSRGRWIAIITTVAVLAVVGAYVPLALSANVDPVDAVVEAAAPTPGAALEFQTPLAAAAAIGPLDGHDIVWSYPDDGGLPMASLTKIITAFVVLEKHPLAAGEAGPSIRFTHADQAIYDQYWLQGVKILPFTAGTSYTERELLEIALIESAANYTDRLVYWAFGSRTAYLTAAHAWLAAHDLSGITVVDPIGQDPANVATPSQLLDLGRLAMADPIISQIVGTPSEPMHGIGVISSTNPILGQDGVNGIKTGNLEDYGANLLFSSQLETPGGTMPVVGVVLGGGDVGAVALNMLAELRDSYHTAALTERGAVFAHYTTPWGEIADAVAGGAHTMIVQGDTPITVSVTVMPLLRGHGGDAVGQAVFTSGDQTVVVPLKLSRDLDGPDAWWRLTHPALIFG